MTDGQVLILVGVLSLAPGALVLVVAMLKGYTVHISMTRRRKDGNR